MPVRQSLRRWLRLPSRIALILGMGALSTATARADAPQQVHPIGFGDLLIRSEGGRLFLSEGGRDFQELRLSGTEEARHLKLLVESRGGSLAPLRISPTILATGGGMGFHGWAPAQKTENPDKTGGSDKPDKPKKSGAPPKPDTTDPGKRG